MKRIASIVLSLMLVLCICITTAGAEEAADRFGKYEEPITITYLSTDENYNSVSPYDPSNPSRASATSNEWITGISEYLNINLERIIAEDTTALNARINTSMASGDMADIILCSKDMFYTLAENGALVDLQDAWDNYEYKNMLLDCLRPFPDLLKVGMIDGEMLGFVYSGAWFNSNGVLWVRRDWLEKVNMEVPTTIEETIAVAQAFVDAKLGGDYTIGLGDEGGSFRDFYAAYGVVRDTWKQLEDGSYIYSNTQDEMKDALLALQEIYASGLIQSDFAVAGTISDEISNGHCGLFYGNATTAVKCIKTNIAYDENSDWMMYYIPTLDGERVVQFGTGGAGRFFCVTNGCEHPEALFKMLEFEMTIRYLGTEEEFKRFMFNEDGYEMWSLNPFRNVTPCDYDLYRGQLVRDGLAAGLTLEEINPICKGQYENALKAVNGDRSGLHHYLAYAIGFGTVYVDLLENGYLYQGYMGPLTENMSLYQSSINEALNSAAIKVIMGEDISVYEKAVETWYASGGQAITDDVNAYYASFK